MKKKKVTKPVSVSSRITALRDKAEKLSMEFNQVINEINSLGYQAKMNTDGTVYVFRVESFGEYKGAPNEKR